MTSDVASETPNNSRLIDINATQFLTLNIPSHDLSGCEHLMSQLHERETLSGLTRMKWRHDAALVFIASMIGVSSSALAQSMISPPGRLLASNCFQCHGTNDTAPGFEKLTGKSASKLLKELKEFQSGGGGENIMAYHARGFTDAQLRELTRWLSAQP
jgi:cytochrome c553